MKRTIFYGFLCLGLFSLPVNAEDKRSDLQEKVLNQPLFQDGKDYYSYKKAVNIPLPKGKVLIQYFYHYDCAVCLNADDYLKQYADRHKESVVLQRSPAFNKENPFTAQMNAALNLYNRPELSNQYLFDSANSKKTQNLVTDNEAIKRWLVRNTIDIKQFHQVFVSEKVKQQVEKDLALYRTYSPPVTPIAILNGKYILVQNTLYNDDYTYAVLDFLVEKLKQDQEN